MSLKKLLSATVLMLFFTASLAYAGLSNVRAWNDTPVIGDANITSGIDIDGEVGHRLTVEGPTTSCQPGGKWSGDIEVASGELPPGLAKQSNGDISGIPTQRGHWVVEMRVYNLTCNGDSYQGYTQELLFHISGSGRVIQ